MVNFILFKKYQGIAQFAGTTVKRSYLQDETLGIEQWTPHDLRRTFATQLGESLQIDPVVIEKCLGHKMPKIMATYNKNEMLPQRKEALEQWGQLIESLISKKGDIDFSISTPGVVANFVTLPQDALNEVQSL